MADMEKQIESQREKDTLVDRLNYLENYYADQLLSDDLKQMYAQIQLNCSDFRENIFFKNIAIMEYNIGKMQNPDIKGRDRSDKEHLNDLKKIKTYDQMIKEYSEKEL